MRRIILLVFLYTVKTSIWLPLILAFSLVLCFVILRSCRGCDIKSTRKFWVYVVNSVVFCLVLIGLYCVYICTVRIVKYFVADLNRVSCICSRLNFCTMNLLQIEVCAYVCFLTGLSWMRWILQGRIHFRVAQKVGHFHESS